MAERSKALDFESELEIAQVDPVNDTELMLMSSVKTELNLESSGIRRLLKQGSPRYPEFFNDGSSHVPEAIKEELFVDRGNIIQSRHNRTSMLKVSKTEVTLPRSFKKSKASRSLPPQGLYQMWWVVWVDRRRAKDPGAQYGGITAPARRVA
ncbi:hypothetical protein J6590_023937 [Homalodisca vitripennis]|nr:hypothetical protein J6590_023937 [Homalodisca vitripennis]